MAPQDAPTYAIVYVRISRDKEGAGLGIDRQREDCEALAERLGFRVIAVYDDNDISAYSGKARPGYRQLLADLEAGRATAVLAWHTDRLHRSPVELEEYITVCEPRGIVTHTVKAGPIDLATPSGRMIARQLGAVARFESEHKSDRARRKRDQMAQAGQWKGGRRPFGYEDNGVTVRPDEAAEVKQASESLLSGMSMHAIVRDWNARGVKTTTGATWSTRSVRNVLTRPRNAGIMEHRGEELGPAEWPAIVDEMTWRSLCALLADPNRRTSPGSERRWLLSGIAECGICEVGGVLTYLRAGTAGKNTGEDRKTAPAYRCRLDDAAKHVVRNAIHLDKYVSAVAVERLSQPGAAAELTIRNDGGAARERAIEREALRIHEQEAGEMFAAREMTRAQLATTNREIAARRAELDLADAAAARVTALAPFASGADASQVWEDLTLDQRRAVISQVMRVVVLPAGKGRPKGWTPEYGKEWGYFDPEAVRIGWKG
ncbi:recombinase family protein [Streptosporangium roseum]|uniref:Site-specific recombinase DNA invertase Pin n=1 Tax=Streptosporangium roseum (strain ATCC 12428 / DSM 43021 / JCM 3005 / KCTC 9067 / NCIMB 10171 / NRRL 2505 / NI 9100) TaxID=479432 RepID=D2AUI3_STRRD|nr:recombinase family protein [Streptosporangium roseum]ACZ84845.1 Site-specific recombinase DNA invertase Pin [Streptosporangium roseum DSM 43021]